MRGILKGLAVAGCVFALMGAPGASAFGGGHGGGGSGGGWHSGSGGWNGGWHHGGWYGGGWGWGGWGYPFWDYGWGSPYLYGYPGDYSYGYPPPPRPEGGLYCVTRTHLCGLDTARAPGTRCSCEGGRGRVSVLRGQ